MITISVSLVAVRILGEIIHAKHQAEGRSLVNFGLLSSPICTLGRGWSIGGMLPTWLPWALSPRPESGTILAKVDVELQVVATVEIASLFFQHIGCVAESTLAVLTLTFALNIMQLTRQCFTETHCYMIKDAGLPETGKRVHLRRVVPRPTTLFSWNVSLVTMTGREP